ncbi:hypothetical protein ROLI_009710 [Roseobacter fucihabitans]|uniref:Uncharacterized protein n=1 Tax=Roseobacter fucihabitans TaxID=1537242 RepID=A0ABZ2BPK1_9RHOB|nr:hypothetical protein [Roseobacter litoralis]
MQIDPLIARLKIAAVTSSPVTRDRAQERYEDKQIDTADCIRLMLRAPSHDIIDGTASTHELRRDHPRWAKSNAISTHSNSVTF